MSLPTIAIMGRPNVGKSRLFNRLVGRFSALVHDESGVTRDRHFGFSQWQEKPFMLIDTGGLIPNSSNELNQKIWEQAFLAVEQADLVLCLFDGKNPPHPEDDYLVSCLRKSGKKVLYLVNKIDASNQESLIYEFSRLGIEKLYPISAEHDLGMEAFMDEAILHLPKVEDTPEDDDKIRVAVIGRPNIGKSTLINRLIKEERLITHNEPGTTRDTIDIDLEYEGEKFLLVDTAGVKRKQSTHGKVEIVSAILSLRAIDRSHIVLLLIDGYEGMRKHDLQLAHHAWSAGKGVILVVNKWDLVEVEVEEYREKLKSFLKELSEIPKIFISALTGYNSSKILDFLSSTYKKMGKTISTSGLNNWLEPLQQEFPPPMDNGRSVKLYYGTQTSSYPPNFLFYSNRPSSIPESYRRFLVHRLQDLLNLKGFPVKINFKQK